MRTVAEIVNRQRAAKDDFFGFAAEVLVMHLPFAEAREFLKPDTKAEEWKALPMDRESVLTEMREYAEFGWEKVENHRGISADRTRQKMEAWVWLLGDDPLNAPYPQYGAPILKAVCERYGFPIPSTPEIARMAAGDVCRVGCDEGCGA